MREHRNRTKTRGMRGAILAVALLGVFALAVPLAAIAKKGKKVRVADVKNTTTRAIPDRLAAAPGTYGELGTTLFVGKKFKGKTVGDLSVTFQTTGADPNSAADLFFGITAPNGRSRVLSPSLGGQSVGPLTMVENSPVQTCPLATPPCSFPWNRLNRPYVGTIGASDLVLLNGVPMKGNWTFTVWDANATRTSTLNLVELHITPAK